MGKLADRLEKEAITWRPEKTDAELNEFESNAQIIEGRIVGVTEGTSQYGPHRILEIEDTDSDDLLRVHMLGQLLDQEYERRQMRQGDDIAIKYLGKKQGKDQTYHNYRVAHEHNTPDPTAVAVPPAAPAPPQPAGPPDDFEPF